MDFKTTVTSDYTWPFTKPIVGKPCEPPKPGPPPKSWPAPVAPYCHCDTRTYGPRVEQYKQLLEKEQKLCQDYNQLRRQMVEVTNDILDHPSDDGGDAKMVSIYQSTYKKKTSPMPDYQTIIDASRSNVPISMESNRLTILRCYKDPTNFTDHPPAVRPSIFQPVVSPKPKYTGADYPGNTEYMDTISATAKTEKSYDEIEKGLIDFKSAKKMDLKTSTTSDFSGPFQKPVLGKPCEAPSPNLPPQSRPAPIAPFCHCNAHSYSPRMEQYQQMLDREQKLVQDYDQLRRQMIDVTNDILDHPCDDVDSKMITMYNATFKGKAGVPEYEPIIAASQSSAPIPMEVHRLGVLTSYKDPTYFTDHPPTVRPTINPPGPVHTGVCPQSIQMYYADNPVRSTYMDTYSVSAKAFLSSMKRYREPMPSSRRRADDNAI